MAQVFTALTAVALNNVLCGAVAAIYILALVVIMGAACVLALAKDLNRTRPTISALYIIASGVGLGFCVHAVMLQERTEMAQLIAVTMLTVFACFGVGFSLYASHIPERFSPGSFDNVGQSHQIWHILIFVGSSACLLGWWKFNRLHLEYGCGAGEANAPLA